MPQPKRQLSLMLLTPLKSMPMLSLRPLPEARTNQPRKELPKKRRPKARRLQESQLSKSLLMPPPRLALFTEAIKPEKKSLLRRRLRPLKQQRRLEAKKPKLRANLLLLKARLQLKTSQLS